jgi:hypothetical protein
MSSSIVQQPGGVRSSPEGGFENIPIIDVSALDSPHREERQKLAAKIYEACTQIGFFYIKVRCRQTRSRRISTDSHIEQITIRVTEYQKIS